MTEPRLRSALSGTQKMHVEVTPGKVLCLRVSNHQRTREANPVALYIRGDTFSARLEDTALAPIVSALVATGVTVVEVDYRHGGEISFPISFELAFATLAFVLQNTNLFASSRSPVFVIGDESGGNIAAGIAIKARDMLLHRLSGQILLSPILDYPEPHAVGTEVDQCTRWMEGQMRYLGSSYAFRHPYAIPSSCTRLVGLPPALIVTSEREPMNHMAVQYARRLSSAGVMTLCKAYPDYGAWTFGQHDGLWMMRLAAELRAFMRELTLGRKLPK